MILYPFPNITTSLFCLIDDLYKIPPLRIIKEILQFPGTPAFDAFIYIPGLFKLFK